MLQCPDPFALSRSTFHTHMWFGLFIGLYCFNVLTLDRRLFPTGVNYTHAARPHVANNTHMWPLTHRVSLACFWFYFDEFHATASALRSPLPGPEEKRIKQCVCSEMAAVSSSWVSHMETAAALIHLSLQPHALPLSVCSSRQRTKLKQTVESRNRWVVSEKHRPERSMFKVL